MEMKYCKTKTADVEEQMQVIEQHVNKLQERYMAFENINLSFHLVLFLIALYVCMLYLSIYYAAKFHSMLYMLPLLVVTIFHLVTFIVFMPKVKIFSSLLKLDQELYRIALGVSTSEDIKEGQKFVLHHDLDDTHLSILLYDDESKFPDTYYEAITWETEKNDVIKGDMIDFSYYDTAFEKIKAEIPSLLSKSAAIE